MSTSKASKASYRGSFGGADPSDDNVINQKQRGVAVLEANQATDAQNRDFGYERLDSGKRTGWLFNAEETTVVNEELSIPESAVDMYFVAEDGTGFCVALPYKPYFYVHVKNGASREVESLFLRKFEAQICNISHVSFTDLDMPNHLAGLSKEFLKLEFRTVMDLQVVRSSIVPLVQKNKLIEKQSQPYELLLEQNEEMDSVQGAFECLSNIVEVREHDVGYMQRVAIDRDIRCGTWYEVAIEDGLVALSRHPTLLEIPEVTVLAFDIETTKAKLKFPDSKVDQVMMISYMIGSEGFLIVNREIVAEDIESFEYTPKPEYPGMFTVFNVADERETLQCFFNHIREAKPVIYVTYNGDFFDWPFIEARAVYNGMDMTAEIGIWMDNEEYMGRFSIHLDAFRWVKRDSYLPQGSQGLKAVTKAKLNYNPVELDPEDMLPFASTNPQLLASYSVSDAVATYYLYMKYVHAFIFSLSMILPLTPANVLRKGSGTLCEQLLMVRASEKSIIAPNKQSTKFPQFYNNQLLDSETYIGGHVECLESGVFREDIKYDFNIDPSAFQELIAEVEDTVRFAIEVEWGKTVEEVTNFNEICEEIISGLHFFDDKHHTQSHPLIYHLDVGAMYPNIILTSRLQPMAIVDQRTCASCDFNVRSKECQRKMDWVWRGKTYPLNRSEFNKVQAQWTATRKEYVSFDKRKEQITQRVKEYSQKAYRKVTIETIETRTATVCMRENSFYVDTVRDFRDRRYEYKELKKVWGKKLSAGDEDPMRCKNMVLLYDSMQLAHKCILNSFYGYVMRRGARWHSMEMAGVVTATGANIIKDARILVERIGTPLELDTDGIWCMLPAEFPENFVLKTADGGKFTMSYACSVLNLIVKQRYTNDQYLTVDPENPRKYSRSSENSIFFEVDGPYRAMIIPAAQQEGKTLKKRYAVYNKDGTLAELKGFEIKRRGELEMLKVFQGQIFPTFLNGDSLKSCYDGVASIANHWIDILERQGEDLDDDELFEYISESRVMSQSLAEYGGRKSTPITAATRLAEFLGGDMVKDKGLCVTFIVSKFPQSSSVSARAIPTVIFSAEPRVMGHFIRKWTQMGGFQDGDIDVREIIDWDYYTKRLGSAIQKIITIPAAFQMVENPVPRVVHPDWLVSNIRERNSTLNQTNLNSFFQTVEKVPQPTTVDLEDIGRPKKELFTKKETLSEKQSSTARTQVVLTNDVDIESDFEGWHRRQKEVWKSMNARKATVPEATIRPNKVRKGGKLKSIGAPIRRSTMLHILDISEDANHPGRFNYWVIRDGGVMKSIRVTHPRTVYINSRISLEDSFGMPITGKTLPRGRSPNFLYEWTMSEGHFQTEAQHEMLALALRPEIEGIYETEVPLAFSLILGSGCMARVAIGKDSFQSSEIENSTSNGAYLKDISVRKLFLYHSVQSTVAGVRGVIALFADDPTLAGFAEAYVVVVNSGGARTDTPSLEQYLEEGSSFRTLKTDYTRSTTVAEALRLINARVTRYQVLGSEAPAVLLAQSCITKSQLLDLMPGVSKCFPLIEVPFNSEDTDLPALNWIGKACKTMTTRFEQIPAWYEQAVKVSDYTQVPLGSLEKDLPQFVADTLYGRLLRQSGQLLWASPNGKPDLGGKSAVWLEGESYFEEEHANPTINTAGHFQTPCFELTIDHLAANSMLLFNVLESIEGGVAPDDDVDNKFGSISPAFKSLRAMVHNLFQDIHQKKSEVADLTLQHFYRWVRTRDSLLYEPLLHRMVHDVMVKVFLRLCFQFKEYNATLVYASFTKIIVNAPKPHLENSISFVKYVVESVLGTDLFKFLSIQADTIWESLLFMDNANYQGIEYQPDDMQVDEESESEQQKASVIGSWNIAEYLPEPTHEYFYAIISEFVYKTYSFQRSLLEEAGDSRVIDWDAERTLVAKHLSDELGSYFTHKLLKLLEWMQYELVGDERSGEEPANLFPVLPGSHLGLHLPALEFCKFVCHVMSLNTQVIDAVNVMRTSLLKFLGTRPFSAEAKFQNPCLTYVLPDVVCEYCNHTQDLDLCRDPRLLAGTWACSYCGHDSDTNAIEGELVRHVTRISTVYQVQVT